MQRRRGFVFGFVSIVTAVMAVNSAPAEFELPSARFSFEGFSVGVLVGFMSGDGTLVFQGREYPFKVRSFSLLDIGGSSLEANGVVYNLTEVMDFEGKYGGGFFGTTVIQGGRSGVLSNGKGVRLQLDTLQSGLELNLGGGGLSVEFEQSVESGATAGEDSVKVDADAMGSGVQQ